MRFIIYTMQNTWLTHRSASSPSYYRAVAEQIAKDYPVSAVPSDDTQRGEQQSLFDAESTTSATPLADVIETLLQQKQLGNSAIPDTVFPDLPTRGIASWSPGMLAADITTPVVQYAGSVALHHCFMSEWQTARFIQESVASHQSTVPTAHNLPKNDLLSAEQARAVEATLAQRLTVISGGPGTGKTTIVAAVIAQQLAKGMSAEDMALTAPTGKAVQRLQESLARQLKVEGSLTFATLHRLLRLVPADFSLLPTPPSQRLPYRLIVVDEASMLDLRLLNQLLSVCREDCQLILLGDRHQLGAIGLGQPFADICRAFQGHAIVQSLSVSYRFDAQSLIGKLANAVLETDVQPFISLATDSQLMLTPEVLDKEIHEAFADYHQLIKTTDSADVSDTAVALLAASQQVKILTSHNHGALGCVSINDKIDHWLGAGAAFYQGKILMMTRNDPVNQLYNGDIGVCCMLDGLPYFVIEAATDSGYRQIPIIELAGLVSAYAMTIHKSQGSEYERVIITLAAVAEGGDRQPEQSVVNRALLYTAITRAKSSLAICADEPAIRHCFAEQTQQTLLADLLHAMRPETLA